jgi:hypothetical protein
MLFRDDAPSPPPFGSKPLRDSETFIGGTSTFKGLREYLILLSITKPVNTRGRAFSTSCCHRKLTWIDLSADRVGGECLPKNVARLSKWARRDAAWSGWADTKTLILKARFPPPRDLRDEPLKLTRQTQEDVRVIASAVSRSGAGLTANRQSA